MDTEKLRYRIGANIAALRKGAGFTQAELADKLNYSDKAVSKWERGESIPDAVTLIQLAKLFGVSVDELLGEDPAVTAAPSLPEKLSRRQRGVIKLSSLLVWFVALTVYVVLSSCGVGRSWVAFVYAIPVNAIVLLSLLGAFGHRKWNMLLISVLVWGVLLSIYITLLVFTGSNVWKVFLLGVLGQAAIFWWFWMLRPERGASHG